MIKASNIEITYDNKRSIINDTTFKINEKDFIFIGGASGSGKSTILNSFFGEIIPISGNLYVNGFDMNNITSSQLLDLRKDIGIVFQDYKLIKNWSIEENIKLPLKINGYTDELCDTQANKLLEHVRLTHVRDSYPQQLSGGEQQRVSVARALAHNPKLILADEPTGNLDEYSASVIWNLLKGANQQLGVTVVVVTHRVPQNFSIDFRKFNIDGGKIYESY
ncbi:MAG: ABC transporter ATP-binding protein [Campylobacteraceae bacterium 4484_166]|nr:MAG: ABC transporter ATP-binding protein [Campylobacteraceae bacterium 4484_166]